MGRQRLTEVKESLEELRKLKRRQKTLGHEKRVECLILLKEGRFPTQGGIARHLSIGSRTLDRWLRTYRGAGLASLVAPIRRERESQITPEIHAGLETKLNDAQNPLWGYRDAQQWVESQYGAHIHYAWLRDYMIKHFGTKLKTPRKSHFKKDPQAQEAFFKTARDTDQD